MSVSQDQANPMPEKPALQWEPFQSLIGDQGGLKQPYLIRAQVPGGWLVALADGSNLLFLADADHAWKLTSGKTRLVGQK